MSAQWRQRQKDAEERVEGEEVLGEAHLQRQARETLDETKRYYRAGKEELVVVVVVAVAVVMAGVSAAELAQQGW